MKRFVILCLLAGLVSCGDVSVELPGGNGSGDREVILGEFPVTTDVYPGMTYANGLAVPQSDLPEHFKGIQSQQIADLGCRGRAIVSYTPFTDNAYGKIVLTCPFATMVWQLTGYSSGNVTVKIVGLPVNEYGTQLYSGRTLVNPAFPSLIVISPRVPKETGLTYIVGGSVTGKGYYVAGVSNSGMPIYQTVYVSSQYRSFSGPLY